MFRALILGVAAAIALATPSSILAGEDGHDHPTPKPAEAVAVEPGEVVIRVNGVVCSFCAHGLEKGLSKLDGLEKERHGNGVLVQVDEQLVRVALLPGQAVPFREIAERIRKAGYDPVRFHLQVAGKLASGEAGSLLTGEAPPQRFWLAGTDRTGPASLQLRVEVAALDGLAADAPVPSVVDATP